CASGGDPGGFAYW
nr:immunoglobulin heavy chain junction region [Mus musculus]MBK4198490.1 immunoglobulin heavy chain junction region [Mus musculus]